MKFSFIWVYLIIVCIGNVASQNQTAGKVFALIYLFSEGLRQPLIFNHAIIQSSIPVTAKQSVFENSVVVKVCFPPIFSFNPC
jgi:hypothetical protein